MRFHYILGMADKKSESDCKRLSADFTLATPYSPPAEFGSCPNNSCCVPVRLIPSQTWQLTQPINPHFKPHPLVKRRKGRTSSLSQVIAHHYLRSWFFLVRSLMFG